MISTIPGWIRESFVSLHLYTSLSSKFLVSGEVDSTQRFDYQRLPELSGSTRNNISRHFLLILNIDIRRSVRIGGPATSIQSFF